MLRIIMGYALAALIWAPVQQLVLGVAPAAAAGSSILAAVMFAALHIAYVNRKELEQERREAAEVQKRLSASLFAFYLNDAIDGEESLSSSH